MKKSLKKIVKKFFSPAKKKNVCAAIVGYIAKDNQITSFKNWIEKTATDIEKDAPSLKEKVGNGRFGGCHIYQLAHDYDIAEFDREELKKLRPALAKLYNVCKQADITLELGGFDLLPWKENMDIGGSGAPSQKGKITVCVDARYKHNHDTNPYEPERPRFGLSVPFFADKDTARFLSRWIEESITTLQKTLSDGDTSRADVDFIIDGNSLDMGKLGAKELKKLRPAFKKLHDICRDHNIAVQLSGFDVLPRTQASGPRSTSSNPYGMWISIDPKREYNFISNPFDDAPAPQPTDPAAKSDQNFKPL